MRDFIEELKASDDVVGFLLEHRKETVKLGVIVLGIMTALLLFLYRGGDEVDITDTATPLEGEEAYSDGAGSRGGLSGEEGARSGLSDDGVTIGNGEVCVDIGGAVKNPMLARLTSGSRVEDAIEQAGGLTSDADIAQINRAEILTDGQKIYIPKKGESGYPGDTGSGAAETSGSGTGGVGGTGTGGSGESALGKVNINTADLTQLQTLSGVGPVTAQKIIDYRTQSGRFSTIEDLKNVSGIGDKTFEKLKDSITV